jgi:hypothetical protein
MVAADFIVPALHVRPRSDDRDGKPISFVPELCVQSRQADFINVSTADFEAGWHARQCATSLGQGS